MGYSQQPYTLLFLSHLIRDSYKVPLRSHLLQAAFPEFHRQRQLLLLWAHPDLPFISCSFSSVYFCYQQISPEGVAVCSRSHGITTDHQQYGFLLCMMGVIISPEGQIEKQSIEGKYSRKSSYLGQGCHVTSWACDPRRCMRPALGKSPHLV